MSFLDRIRACNRHDLSRFLPLRVDEITVGWLRPAFARVLQQWPEVFRVGGTGVDLASELESFDQRTRAISGVLKELREQGVLSHLDGEPYVATAGERDQGLFVIDRAAAPYFKIRAFGQHINGFVGEGEHLKLWVARRAADRRRYPGKLDNLVAGGLPYGLSPKENLLKEAREEAGLSEELAGHARWVATLSYNAETPQGFKPDTLYCYDLALPEDFCPRCGDGEVEDFYLWPIQEVAETVRQTDQFKFNCNLVIIDFLIRHGYLGPDDEEYSPVIEALYSPAMRPSFGTGFRVSDPEGMLDLSSQPHGSWEPSEPESGPTGAISYRLKGY